MGLFRWRTVNRFIGLLCKVSQGPVTLDIVVIHQTKIIVGAVPFCDWKSIWIICKVGTKCDQSDQFILVNNVDLISSIVEIGFPRRWGANPRDWGKILLFGKDFCRKLHENQRHWTGDPLGSANAKGKRIWGIKLLWNIILCRILHLGEFYPGIINRFFRHQVHS